MSKLKFGSIIAVCLIVAISAGWDIYAINVLGNDGATVSRAIFDISAKFPILPLGVGVIIGHLFWPQTRNPS
jgi:hypothetical protein